MIFILHPLDNGNIRRYPALLCLVIVVLFIFPCVVSGAEPTISGITPADGVNTNLVSVNISGTNFMAGANVILTPMNCQPVHKGSITDGTDGALLKFPVSVFVSGNHAYVASKDSNALEIIDISDPAQPVHKGSIVNGEGGALLNGPASVFVSGNYAFIADSGTGMLEIIDVSDPAHPVHTSSYAITGHGIKENTPKTVTVSGNYAYFGNLGGESMEIIDISEPTHPVHKGSIVDGDGGARLVAPSSIVIAGRYAYVTGSATGEGTLEIIDISDPAHPVHKGSIVNHEGGALMYSPNSVFISGRYAYIVGGAALEIVDISDPAHPVHSGTITDNSIKGGSTALNYADDVFVSGNYAYISAGSSYALEVVDVSDPAHPTHKGSIFSRNVRAGKGTGALLDGPMSVSISGDYAYVASSGALEIVDIGTVQGTGVTVVSPTQVACTFDLTNKNGGPYNVVVTNPDGSFGVMSSGFAVIPSTVPTAKQSSLPPLVPAGAVICAGVITAIAIRRGRR